VVELMHEFKHDPAWADVARELSGAAATAQWWANEVRAER
jgi:hypothetical protein